MRIDWTVKIRNVATFHMKVFAQGAVRLSSPSISIEVSILFYEISNERHSDRAASRLSLNVPRVESDLCELNRL